MKESLMMTMLTLLELKAAFGDKMANTAGSIFSDLYDLVKCRGPESQKLCL
jgi:hypothetical protein